METQQSDSEEIKVGGRMGTDSLLEYFEQAQKWAVVLLPCTLLFAFSCHII